LWIIGWLLVGAAGLVGRSAAVTVLVLALCVFSLAESLYDAVYGRRYPTWLRRNCWAARWRCPASPGSLALILCPVPGAALLSLTPVGTWFVAAALCLGAAWYVLGLDRQLPDPSPPHAPSGPGVV
jgi:hypothetical protein